MAKLIIDNLGLGLSSHPWVGYGHTYPIGDKTSKNGQLLKGSLTNPFIYTGGLTLSSLVGTRIFGDETIFKPIYKMTANLWGTGLLAMTSEKSSSTGNSPAVYWIPSTTIPEGVTSNTLQGTSPWPRIVDMSVGQPHNGHTGLTFLDIFNYQLNGIPWTFVLTVDNTDWDLFKIPKNATNDDYISSTTLLTSVGQNMTNYATSMLNGAASYSTTGRVFAIPSENGFAYIMYKNHIHKLDGTTAGGGATGKITADVLVFPDNYKIIDALEKDGKMWILVNTASTQTSWSKNSTPIGLYVWDKNSTTVGLDNLYRTELIVDATSLFILDGILYIAGIGSDNISRLVAFDGMKLVGVSTYDMVNGIKYSSPANRDSIIPYMNGVLWRSYYSTTVPTTYHSDMFWYGKITSADNNGLAIFKLSEDTLSDVMAMNCIGISGNTIYTGSNYLSGGFGTPTIWINSPANISSSSINGKLIFTDIALPKLSTVNGLTIIYAGKATGTGNIVATISNKHTGSIPKIESIADASTRGYSYFQLGMEKTNKLRLKLELTGTSTATTQAFPIIDRIEIDYTPSTRTI